MPIAGLLRDVWGFRWIFRLASWIRRKAIENLKHEIQGEIDAGRNKASIALVHPDFLAWSRRVSEIRARLEADGAEAQQLLFYPLNIEPLGASYHDIKAPLTIEERLERLQSLGDFGSSAAKAVILSGDILASEPNSPDAVDVQMDRLRKLDGVLQLGLKQLTELRNRELTG